MTAALTKTHSTKLTPEETARAAAGIKLLAASMGFTQYTALHSRLTAAGYPASYATFGRLMNATRVAQRSEIDLIARYFNVQPRDLTGEAVNPVKDPAPPRLIELDAPAQAVEEGPATLPRVMRAVSRPAKASAGSVDALILAEAINDLAAAVRELTAGRPRTEYPQAG